MGRYCGCCTIEEVGKMERKRVKRILKGYGLPKEVIHEVCDAVSEGWFQLEQLNEFTKRMQEYLKEVHDIDLDDNEVVASFMKWEIKNAPDWVKELYAAGEFEQEKPEQAGAKAEQAGAKTEQTAESTSAVPVPDDDMPYTTRYSLSFPNEYSGKDEIKCEEICEKQEKHSENAKKIL